MSILMFESWDTALFGRGFNNIPTTANVNTASGLHDRGINLGDRNNLSIGYTPVLSGTATFVMGYAYKNGDTSTSVKNILDYSSNIANRNRFTYTPITGLMTIRYDDNTTETFDPAPMMDKAWHFVEWKFLYSNTVGTVELVVDGVSVFAATNKDTGPASAAKAQWFGASGSQWDYYMDDMYFLDGNGAAPYNDFLGVGRCDALIPDGNGATSGLTGSDADQTDNYLHVDTQAIDEANYNESATEGDLDTYAIPALGATADVIYGVQVRGWVEKSDSGTKFSRLVLRSNSVDYVGASVALPLSWAEQREIWEQDPNTSLAWTESGVNASEPGFEVRDS